MVSLGAHLGDPRSCRFHESYELSMLRLSTSRTGPAQVLRLPVCCPTVLHDLPSMAVMEVDGNCLSPSELETWFQPQDHPRTRMLYTCGVSNPGSGVLVNGQERCSMDTTLRGRHQTGGCVTPQETRARSPDASWTCSGLFGRPRKA